MIRQPMRHALAGLHAGILGAILMLLWLMLSSILQGHSAWRVPNLFSTTFFGPDAYRNGFFRATWSGLSLILTIYGTLGIFWGVLAGDRRPPFLTVYGGVVGLLLYYLSAFLWQHLNPSMALYAPTRQLQIAHVIWGMTLARSPRYARRMLENA